MGNQPPEVKYARFIPKTKKPGFTPELISYHNDTENDFKTTPWQGVDTVWKGFTRTAKMLPNQNFLGTRDADQEGRPYVWKTYGQVLEIVQNLSRGLIALNLVPKTIVQEEQGSEYKFMGIYGKNREEWAITHLATISISATSVALYDTLGPTAIQFVLRQTELTSVSCSGDYLGNLIMLKNQGKAEHLKNLISFDSVDNLTRQNALDAGLNLYTMDEVIEAGIAAVNIDLKTDAQEPTPETCFIFNYTSGTTSDPKAVKLTHANLVATATAAKYSGLDTTLEDIVISYLPYAHVFEQVILVMCIGKAVQVGYYSGDVLKIAEDCAVLKPTLFPSVPRLYNKIYDLVQKAFSELPAHRAAIARKAINDKLYYLENGCTYDYYLYDKLVCKKIKERLGGNVRLMATGSAPIAPEVVNFLKVAFCCPILEGYGLTETCGASCFSLPDDPISGQVGGPTPSVKVKLRDIPQMEYLSTDKPYPRGEICFKGPSVFNGYFKNPEQTLEAFTEDGWFMSGDVGMIYPNGSIKVIDRAKSIFKLQQGEYIAPEKLENVYNQCPYVEQIVVHGDSFKTFIVAIVIPEVEYIKNWAKSSGKEFATDQDIFTDQDVSKLIMDNLNQLAVDNKLNGLEKVKRIYVHNELMTPENGLLTPTMKLKRPVAVKHFQEQINEMYSN